MKEGWKERVKEGWKQGWKEEGSKQGRKQGRKEEGRKEGRQTMVGPGYKLIVVEGSCGMCDSISDSHAPIHVPRPPALLH